MEKNNIYNYRRDITSNSNNLINLNNSNISSNSNNLINSNNSNNNLIVQGDLENRFKSSQYYNEKIKSNKDYFFSLLNKIKTTYVEVKTNPNDEIEKLYNGYISKVENFHIKDKILNNGFKKENEELNVSIEKLIKDLEKKNKVLEKLKKDYKTIVSSGNAFDEQYTHHIYDYNFTIYFTVSLLGLSSFMLYLSK